LLGLAAKKGSIVSGGDACERALKKGAGGLLIIAGDAAGNTRDRFAGLSRGGKADLLVFGARGELGRRIGKGDRSVVLVTDKGLAFGILELLGLAEK